MKFTHQDIPGYTNDTDFESLHKICELAPDSGILFEIGPLFGRSTLFFAETLRKMNKDYKIISLDLFSDSCYHRLKQNLMHGDLTLLDPIKNKQLSTLELVYYFCSGYPEITLLKHDLFFHIPVQLMNKKISVIFEDTMHTYESTTRCLEAYFPMLEKNGIYSGDDYSWSQVKKAVDTYSAKHSLEVNTQGKIWWLNARS